MAASAMNVHVDMADLRKLYKDLAGFEGNLRAELRRELKSAGEEAARAVRREANWSRRIPAAVKVVPSFSARSTGISIQVDAKRAPEARALEGGGRHSTFRHPVFGNRDVWVNQKTRPFFYAQVGAADQVEAHVRTAMDNAARKAGFTGN